jgi:hypothetical protein
MMPFMSAWRREAFERLPAFRTLLQKSNTPYALWIELSSEFRQAYQVGDLERFEHILSYANWCLAQPEGRTAADDFGTCLQVCFFEHLPAVQVGNQTKPKNRSGGILAETEILRYPGIQELHSELLARGQRSRDS